VSLSVGPSGGIEVTHTSTQTPGGIYTTGKQTKMPGGEKDVEGGFLKKMLGGKCAPDAKGLTPEEKAERECSYPEQTSSKYNQLQSEGY